MPKIAIPEGFELDVRDDGVIEMSSLPEALRGPVQKEIDRMFGKGAAKAAQDALKQQEAAVAAAVAEAKKNGGDPVLAEKARNLELELSKLREDEAMRTKNYDEAKRLIEERHQKELADREGKVGEAQKEIERRTGRIRELVTSDIRVAAIRHGARDESLDELEQLLKGKVELDKDLQAYVKDEKDPEKPKVGADGKPVTIDGLVQQYLTDHAHHKKPAGGRGGGAGGGASLAGGKPGANSEFAAATEKVAQNPTHANLAEAMKNIGKAS